MLTFNRSLLVKRIFRFGKTYLTLQHIYMPSNISAMTEFYFQKVVVSCHSPSTGVLSCLNDSLSASLVRGILLVTVASSFFFFLNLLLHIVSLNFSSSFKELPDLLLSFLVTTANDHQLSDLLTGATLNNAGILTLDLVSHALLLQHCLRHTPLCFIHSCSCPQATTLSNPSKFIHRQLALILPFYPEHLLPLAVLNLWVENE